MGTLVYFAVPLYRIFCEATGFGGTTRVATAAPNSASSRTMAVRFDANTAPDLPWKFSAPEPIKLRLGEERLVAFTAINLGPEPILGTAVFNVTPHKAGQYFNKVECFCFTEQLLMPGERKEFPVTFFIDAAMAQGLDVRDVGTITLSYAFLNKGKAARDEYLRIQQAALGADQGSTR